MKLKKMIFVVISMMIMISQNAIALSEYQKTVRRKVGGELLTCIGAVTLAGTCFFMHTVMGQSMARKQLRKKGVPMRKGDNPFAADLRNLCYVLGAVAVGLGIWLKQ